MYVRVLYSSFTVRAHFSKCPIEFLDHKTLHLDSKNSKIRPHEEGRVIVITSVRAHSTLGLECAHTVKKCFNGILDP